MRSRDKIFLAIGSVAILAATGFGGYALFTGSEASSQPTSPTTVITQSISPAATTTTTTTTSTSNVYADGTYTAIANYLVPHGNVNSINLTLTVSADKITSASSTNKFSDGESAAYIDSFKSSLSSSVVGKPLGGVSYSRIGGASLTTSGFLQALKSIQNNAKA